MRAGSKNPQEVVSATPPLTKLLSKTTNVSGMRYVRNVKAGFLVRETHLFTDETVSAPDCENVGLITHSCNCGYVYEEHPKRSDTIRQISIRKPYAKRTLLYVFAL